MLARKAGGTMKKTNFTDIYPDKLDYEVLLDVVQSCGKAHNPRSFAIDILHHINKIAPFDQGMAMFIDGNKKLVGQYLRGVDDKSFKTYTEHYSEAENKKYSYAKDVRENPNAPTINVHAWEKEKPGEFVDDYIYARGLKYSCGFALYDLHGNYRLIFSLDRLKEEPFSNKELYNLQQAVFMLNDLHKNFYYVGASLKKVKQKTWAKAKLTAREIEVVDLMAQGISPANISRILYISLSTTYKHIAHIYDKMSVSSQQELLVKLLREQELSEDLD